MQILKPLGYKADSEEDKADTVKKIFDVVSQKYDLMNDILSLGMHRLWKRDAIEATGAREGSRVLDIASGTGDLAIALARKVGATGTVFATDINVSMLKAGIGRMKQAGVSAEVLQCDCEALPFKDGAFDAVTVSFGLRNMTHKDKALSEMLRVVKPGGRVVVLEFSHCAKWLRPLYDLYSFWFMPWISRLITGDGGNYRYLAESIRLHPDQKTLAALMSAVGFDEVTWCNKTFGICALHVGRKPVN
ncbi:MAG: bifunctional demethylmenaquinone methyltransferase/2-methoxy-6-polyprenyl-1,4-benzoquinol methylase UbiE [Duodenibacillus sp.]|nr:bifunctional demethylmenaquinone methyltransferase/2-methoxy-6-polyprenyl-1,4-benzoquinol methylase UbiE [Duodenibacillus sp.]